MYVCICNAITDKQIRNAAADGADDLWALQRELGVASGCGTCRQTAAEILGECRAARQHEDEPAQVRIHRPSAS